MTIRTIAINGKEWVSSGINPSRFVGVRYSTPCLGLARAKKDHRPMLTVHIIFATIWIKLPWRHSDQEPGWTIGKSWGAVFSAKARMRPLLYWGSR